MVKCQCRICPAVLLLKTDCAHALSVSTGSIANDVPYHRHVLLALASGLYLYAQSSRMDRSAAARARP